MKSLGRKYSPIPATVDAIFRRTATLGGDVGQPEHALNLLAGHKT